jgi:hypothetical protein
VVVINNINRIGPIAGVTSCHFVNSDHRRWLPAMASHHRPLLTTNADRLRPLLTAAACSPIVRGFALCATNVDLCDNRKSKTLKSRASQIANYRTNRKKSHKGRKVAQKVKKKRRKR